MKRRSSSALGLRQLSIDELIARMASDERELFPPDEVSQVGPVELVSPRRCRVDFCYGFVTGPSCSAGHAQFEVVPLVCPSCGLPYGVDDAPPRWSGPCSLCVQRSAVRVVVRAPRRIL